MSKWQVWVLVGSLECLCSEWWFGVGFVYLLVVLKRGRVHAVGGWF